MRGSALRSARAQVAPPKPPPITTTRAPALWARTAGDKMAADAAAAIVDLSTLRRFGRIRSISAFGVVRRGRQLSPERLERDDFSSNRHPALAYSWSMIFSENRCPPRIKSGAGFFGIMLMRS